MGLFRYSPPPCRISYSFNWGGGGGGEDEEGRREEEEGRRGEGGGGGGRITEKTPENFSWIYVFKNLPAQIFFAVILVICSGLTQDLRKY